MRLPSRERPRLRELSSTSFAILGLLALRSWPAYELTKQGRRSLRYCWPRAESRIYQELKHLAAHGLAEVRSEAVGRRPRSVYSITTLGRRALAEWLEEPSAPPSFESEALLRMALAEHGTKEGTLEALRQLEAHATTAYRQAASQAEEYLRGGGEFRERAHILAVVAKFVLDHNALLASWARWAQDEVASWPSMGPAADLPVAFDALAAAARTPLAAATDS